MAGLRSRCDASAIRNAAKRVIPSQPPRSAKIWNTTESPRSKFSAVSPTPRSATSGSGGRQFVDKAKTFLAGSNDTRVKAQEKRIAALEALLAEVKSKETRR